jgi:hypothetical protein
MLRANSNWNEMTLPSSYTDARMPVLRRLWTKPVVESLPKLVELTLQSGPAIPGGGDVGGGSTVFP